MLPADRIPLRDLSILGSVGYTTAAWAHMVALLRESLVDLDPIVTHRFPLERFEDAFALMDEREASSGGSCSSTRVMRSRRACRRRALRLTGFRLYSSPITVARPIRASVKTSSSSVLMVENSETTAPSSPAWNQWSTSGGIVCC